MAGDLRDELLNDPLARGYSTMPDLEARELGGFNGDPD